MLLHLALALSMLAPPSPDTPAAIKAAAKKAFNDGEWQQALDLYLELAKAPGVHAPNALVGAHDSLRALHQQCRALDLARAVLRRDDLTDGDRSYWLALEVDDAKVAGPACPSVSPVAPTPTEPTPTEPTEPPAEKPTEPPGDPTPTDTTPPVAPAAAPEGPAAAPAVKDIRPRRTVARIAVGSAFSAAAAGLTGGMIGVLVRRDHANATIEGITKDLVVEHRNPTEAEAEAVADARVSYKEDGTNAWVLGIVGALSLATGLVVFLAPPRSDSSARLRASAGGIVYSF